MNRFIFLFIILGPFVAYSQSENLVPNHSFEQYKTLPNDIAQGRKCLVNWKIPNAFGAGDYYHAGCSTKKAGVPKNYFGKQVPRTGKAYMGICITKRFREYLQVELLSPLIKHRQYKIIVYVSCGDKRGLSTIDELNVLFSGNSFTVPNNEDLLIVPIVKLIGDFKNKKEWVELSAIYTATGTERFLTLGSFTYEENGLKHGEIHGASNYAHYNIDDVSVTLLMNQEHIDTNKKSAENLISDSTEIYITGKTYVFDKLLFESGKSVLLQNEYPELDELIHFLQSQSHYKLLITGHTDNIGDKDFNKKLSYDRASSVKLYLIENGINENAITIEGKGDLIPLMSNDTEEGRRINRRVQITLLE